MAAMIAPDDDHRATLTNRLRCSRCSELALIDDIRRQLQYRQTWPINIAITQQAWLMMTAREWRSAAASRIQTSCEKITPASSANDAHARCAFT